MASYRARLYRIFRHRVFHAQRLAGLATSMQRFKEAAARLYDIQSADEYLEYVMMQWSGEPLPENQLGKQWTISLRYQVSHGDTYETIANPANWYVRSKIREKASQLTDSMANDVTLSRIKYTINALAGKLIVSKMGGRLEMVALSRLISFWNPDLSPIRINRIVKHLLEQSGHSIVLTHGRYYLCDYALVPFPPPITP